MSNASLEWSEKLDNLLIARETLVLNYERMMSDEGIEQLMKNIIETDPYLLGGHTIEDIIRLGQMDSFKSAIRIRCRSEHELIMSVIDKQIEIAYILIEISSRTEKNK